MRTLVGSLASRPAWPSFPSEHRLILAWFGANEADIGDDVVMKTN